MRLLQHLRQHLAESRFNIFAALSDDERVARTVHDRQVDDMARRLDDEMDIRTGCNGTPRADQRGTQ